MKNIKCQSQIYLLLIVAISILNSCKKDNVQPDQTGQLAINGSVEKGSARPEGWTFDNGQNKYEVVWTNQESFSPTRSLKISTKVADASSFSFWAQTISDSLPTGKSVTLKVKIKSNLTGQGSAIALRGDNALDLSGSAEQFATTAGSISITGVFDWKEYKVKLDKVEATTFSLSVFLLYLPNTTGEVYFDDIELVY